MLFFIYFYFCRLRRRRVYEPEVIAEASDSEESVKEVERPSRSAITITMNEEESSDEGELDEDVSFLFSLQY